MRGTDPVSEDNQNDRNRAKSRLINGNLIRSRKDAGWPQHPGSKREEPDSDQEQNCFGNKAKLKQGVCLLTAGHEEEGYTRDSNNETSTQNFPTRSRGNKGDKLFKPS